MRFAFVITQADSVGGSNVHVRDLSKALIGEGHEVRVFVGGEGPYTVQLKDLGIPYELVDNLVHPIDPVRDLKCGFELKRRFLAFKPDLISCHSTKAGLCGRLGGKLAKIPTIFTAHGWLFTEGVGAKRQAISRITEQWAAKFSAKIITVCDDDRRLALANHITGPDHLITIHNGMPDAPERAVPETEPMRFIMVARMDQQKDHATLLKSLATIQDLPWNLDLVGDGALRSATEQLAKELGIFDRITFHGAQRYVRGLLGQAQTFVLVTHYEGFPRSTVEAMCAGLPVIVTDVNGCKEALTEGVTGFAVPVHDVEALAEKLRTVIESPELRKQMGIAGRKRYEDTFTFDRMFEKTKAVYAEVLGRPIS